jgi:hypothetical protein
MDSTQLVAEYWLFHYCITAIMEPLVAATYGPDGVAMMCADGYMCKVFPILVAYLADHPKQCLIVCCHKNHCPKCKVRPKEHSKYAEALPCDPKKTY